MNSLKYLTILLTLLTSQEILSQTKFPGCEPGYYTPYPNSFVDVPTPTASSLGKYGDMGMSYYTGTPNIRIPLYTLKVREVSLPIALNYEASGVMPNNLPSCVGQNWTLDIGGVITRTVNDRHDEWKYPRQSGLAQKTHNYFEAPGKLDSLLVHSNNNYSQLKDEVENRNYDLAPDVFTFHFMGKSGRFFMDPNGSWRVMSDDNLEVIFDKNDPSNFTSPLFKNYPYATAYQREQPKTIAGFVIRDDNGNTYYFGYDDSAIEYTTNFWKMSEAEQNESWHAMSWYLTKVEDRLGNELYRLRYERGAYIIQVFNSYFCDEVKEKASGIFPASHDYMVSNMSFPYTFTINSPVYLSNIKTMSGVNVVLKHEYVEDCMATEKLYSSLYNGFSNATDLHHTLASMVQGWNSTDIGAFYYLQNDGKELDRYRYNPQNADKHDILSRSRLKRLRYISINVPNAKPDSYIGFRFQTSYVNHRLRLDSLMVQDAAVNYDVSKGVKEVYRFGYDNFEKLPSDYLTTEIDHWGYYNGTPYFDRSTRRPKNNLEAVRNPNFTYTRIGMLTEIRYPTGGVSQFEYEPNSYSRILAPNRQSYFNTPGTGGGLRIKSIRTLDSKDSHSVLSEHTFNYDIPGTNVSSGELFSTPIYYWPNWRIRCEQKGVTYHMSTTHSSSVVPLANSNGINIGYSYVTETVKNSDGTITEQHVFNYSNLSSIGTNDQRAFVSFGYSNDTTPYDEYSERGFMRGKLISETVYDASGTKAHSTTYHYRTDSPENKYRVPKSNLAYDANGSAQFAHFTGGVNYLYYPKYDCTERIDSDFCSTADSPVATSLKYNKKDIDYVSGYKYQHNMSVRLTYSETATRNGLQESTTYDYANFDNSGNLDSIMLKSTFLLSPLTVTRSSNGTVTSKITTTYRIIPYQARLCVQPDRIIYSNNNARLDTLVTYLKYSPTGAPLEYKEMGKPITYLTWALGDNYLLLKSHSNNKTDVSNSDFLDSDKCRTILKKAMERTDGQTVAYVYNPMFGPIDIIRPNGNVTTYKYDSFGRLTAILDNNGCKRYEYEYNYRR